MWRSRSGTCSWARPARSAVNIPGLTPEVMERLKPHLQLAETLGQLLSPARRWFRSVSWR
jgi:hypothetical protein